MEYDPSFAKRSESNNPQGYMYPTKMIPPSSSAQYLPQQQYPQQMQSNASMMQVPKSYYMPSQQSSSGHYYNAAASRLQMRGPRMMLVPQQRQGSTPYTMAPAVKVPTQQSASTNYGPTKRQPSQMVYHGTSPRSSHVTPTLDTSKHLSGHMKYTPLSPSTIYDRHPGSSHQNTPSVNFDMLANRSLPSAKQSSYVKFSESNRFPDAPMTDPRLARMNYQQLHAPQARPANRQESPALHKTPGIYPKQYPSNDQPPFGPSSQPRIPAQSWMPNQQSSSHQMPSTKPSSPAIQPSQACSDQQVNAERTVAPISQSILAGSGGTTQLTSWPNTTMASTFHRIEGTFETRNYTYTEGFLRGLFTTHDKSPDALDKFMDILIGLSGHQPQHGVWTTECWRAYSASNNDNFGRLTHQQNVDFQNELWLRKYIYPEHLRDTHCLRLYSAKHVVTSSTFALNTRRVKESAVGPQFTKILPSLGYKKSVVNTFYSSGHLFTFAPGGDDGNRSILILIQRHYKNIDLQEDLFPGNLVVEIIGRIVDDYQLQGLSQQILEISQHLKPFVYFHKL